MIDLQKYLSSGIIENYCLGALPPEEASELEGFCQQYPEVKRALKETQNALVLFVDQYEKEPLPKSKERLLATINQYQLDQMVLDPATNRINKFVSLTDQSPHQQWQKKTAHLNAPINANIHSQQLYRDEKRQLSVVWIKESLPDEVHSDIHESFLVVEGRCECMLGDKKVKLKAGSFLSIPLNVVHSLKVTSKEPLKVILTRVKLA